MSGTANDNPYQYTGRENDGTGLYHYRARYYSPGMQRFVSEDPIGLAGGNVNLYAYVGGDPVNATDPSGLMAMISGPQGTINLWSNGKWALFDAVVGLEDRIVELWPDDDGALLKDALGWSGGAVEWVIDCAGRGLTGHGGYQGCLEIDDTVVKVGAGCGIGTGFSQTQIPAFSPAPVRGVAAALGCVGGGVLGGLDIPVRAITR